VLLAGHHVFRQMTCDKRKLMGSENIQQPEAAAVSTLDNPRAHSSSSVLKAKLYSVGRYLRLRPFDDETPEGRSDERHRRILLTSGSALAARVVSGAAALVTVPLTVKYLGAERYGLWMTISSLISLLGFADFGMGNGLLTAISAAHGRGDRDEARRNVTSAFFMLSGVAVLIALAFILSFPWLDWGRVFNVSSPIARHEAGPTMAVLAAFLCLNMPLGIVQRVQQGYQEGFASNLWGVAGNILALIALLVAISLKVGLPWLALAMSGGPAVAALANWVVMFGRSRTWLFPRFRFFDRRTAIELAGSGSLFFVLTVCALIASSSDNLVIAHVIGPTAVAKYAITQKIFITLALAQYFIAPLWPAFGEAIARKDYAWAHRTLKRAIELSLWAGVLTAVPLLVFGRQLISWWVGPAMVPSVALLLGFSAWLLLAGYGGVMSMFLNSGTLLRKQVGFYVAASTTAVILKIVLAYVWGIEGVIFGTVAGWTLVYVVPSGRLAFGYLRSLDTTATGLTLPPQQS
jgi:O-antigen/teichoic acid export membrane protein